jgi:hypothetical protein
MFHISVTNVVAGQRGHLRGINAGARYRGSSLAVSFAIDKSVQKVIASFAVELVVGKFGESISARAARYQQVRGKPREFQR